ncbi:MAG: hypothetical protein KDB21_11990 [Acidimicrobiales bacterium]|nr:hypothetical protein [Acidimicrobiales bacterium]
MLIALWSVKGGVGTTTTAALLARRSAANGAPTLALDLSGDLGAALGLPTDAAPGVLDWLRSASPPPDALGRLEVPSAPGLSVLPLGAPAEPDAGDAPTQHDGILRLAAGCSATTRTVIADLGRLGPGHEDRWLPVLNAARRSLLVVRPCYLGLRRAAHCPARPHGLIVISDPGRALRAADAAEVVGVPVALELTVDPGVARMVDAGLAAARSPRGLERVLDDALERLDALEPANRR